MEAGRCCFQLTDGWSDGLTSPLVSRLEPASAPAPEPRLMVVMHTAVSGTFKMPSAALTRPYFPVNCPRSRPNAPVPALLLGGAGRAHLRQHQRSAGVSAKGRWLAGWCAGQSGGGVQILRRRVASIAAQAAWYVGMCSQRSTERRQYGGRTTAPILSSYQSPPTHRGPNTRALPHLPPRL